MTTTEISVKMILDRWNGAIKSFDSLINTIPDETLKKEVAPNKNRGVYLLGHMVAEHDLLLRMLDMGEKLYPELEEPFIKQADKVATETPSIATLRSFWTKQYEVIKQKFDTMKTEDWFEKHTSVSTEDFEKQPHRNKLNIIVTRTSHLQHHIGQLSLLK